MNRCMLLLATLGATTLMCVVVGTASARSFSISNQSWRTIYHPYLPEEPLREPEQREQWEISSPEIVTYRCRLTLEGSFHSRSIAKIAESLIGYVNSATLGECPINDTRVLRETLPWHIRYRSFAGTLPSIVEFTTVIVGFAMSIREPFGVRCLGRSTATEPVFFRWTREAGGRWREAGLSGSITTANCPFVPRLTMGGTTRVPQAIQSTVLTLI
jgi:hypothetical protein